MDWIWHMGTWSEVRQLTNFLVFLDFFDILTDVQEGKLNHDCFYSQTQHTIFSSTSELDCNLRGASDLDAWGLTKKKSFQYYLSVWWLACWPKPLPAPKKIRPVHSSFWEYSCNFSSWESWVTENKPCDKQRQSNRKLQSKAHHNSSEEIDGASVFASLIPR